MPRDEGAQQRVHRREAGGQLVGRRGLQHAVLDRFADMAGAAHEAEAAARETGIDAEHEHAFGNASRIRPDDRRFAQPSAWTMSCVRLNVMPVAERCT